MSINDWKNEKSKPPSIYNKARPFWSAPAGYHDYHGRPDGLEVTHVCTAGVCNDYFDNRAQIVVTEGGVFHVHAVGGARDERQRIRTVPVASYPFGPDADKARVISWVRMVMEMTELENSDSLTRYAGKSRKA